MEKKATIAILGTYDSKADEHLFLKERIGKYGQKTLTINVGVKSALSSSVDIDLFSKLKEEGMLVATDREKDNASMISK